MSAVSGQYGTLHIGASELIEVTNWKFNRRAAVHSYCSNTTGGFKKTVVGTKSGSGSFTGMYDPSDPADSHVGEGDDATAKLYYTDTQFLTVPLTVETFDLECDLDEGRPVGWTANFVTDGEWS